MKVSILTLGCRVNQSESNDLQSLLESNRVNIVELKDKPDYCIVNTCAVTARGDHDSRHLIRKALSTGARVIVTGCYSQLSSDEVKKIDGKIEIIDISKKSDIADTIRGGAADSFSAGYRISRPFLKVQDGCNFSCSYCTVPLARGKSRSIPLQDIVRKAKAIEAAGYHEIVLTGIHLGAFGHDLHERHDLRQLVLKILAETCRMRIRLSSLEINEINGSFLDLFESPRICRHLHIPLQSGSSRILRSMKRGYDAERFRSRIEQIAGRVENIAIGTDVMAGFPGEDDSDFLLTYDLINDLPLSYLHIFPFSPRPQTAAFAMGDRVPQRDIRDRVLSLKGLDECKRKAYRERQMAEVLDVVVEEIGPDGSAIGTSANYLKVRISDSGIEQGSLVSVRPKRMRNNIIDAVVVEKR